MINGKNLKQEQEILTQVARARAEYQEQSGDPPQWRLTSRDPHCPT